MNALKILANKKFGLFIIGTVAGLILPPVLKSKTTRKVVVAATAKGMELKDNAVATFESVKEEAQDVYAEAKHKNAVSNDKEVEAEV